MVLAPIFDQDFSPFSYGFRPDRNAHQALRQAKSYINEGYQDIIDLDLKSFFDEVNHDLLLNLLGRKVKDPLLLKLIHRFLTSGLLLGGVVGQRDKGTPQGGPLSPLLSNILLDQLDKELTRRGHRFVRYADDCSIFLRSKRSAHEPLSTACPAALRDSPYAKWLERDNLSYPEFRADLETPPDLTHHPRWTPEKSLRAFPASIVRRPDSPLTGLEIQRR